MAQVGISTGDDYERVATWDGLVAFIPTLGPGKAYGMTMSLFLAIPPLYDTESKPSVPKPTIGGLAVAAITAGFALSPLLAFASRNLRFRVDAVFIPNLGSSSLALVVLLVDFALFPRYQWNAPAYCAVAAAAIGTAAYALLAAHAIRRIQYRNRRLRHRSASEAALTQHDYAGSTPDRGRSVSTAPQGQRDRSQDSRKDSLWGAGSHISRHNPHQLYDPVWNLPLQPVKPTSAHSIRSQTQPSSPERPNAAEPAGPPVPIQAEDMTRQQMLKLLITQTSEQAMRNPDTSTFHIELPHGMRQALRSNTLDADTFPASVESNPGIKTLAPVSEFPVSGSPAPPTGAPTSAWKTGLDPPRSSSVLDTPAEMYPDGRSRYNAEILWAQSEALRAPSNRNSVQATPATMYGSQWKTREERRREIEMGKR